MIAIAFGWATLINILTQTDAVSFPQYAQWISKRSGVQVDCTYCHLSPDGPQGTGPGQLGSIKEDQLKLVHTADSPIVNAFGKSILKHIGYQEFIRDTEDPSKLSSALKAYDLDGDGVSDGDEMEHGTLANDPLSAPPALLSAARLKRHGGFIAEVALSGILAASGFWGLSRQFSEKNN